MKCLVSARYTIGRQRSVSALSFEERHKMHIHHGQALQACRNADAILTAAAPPSGGIAGAGHVSCFVAEAAFAEGARAAWLSEARVLTCP